MKRIVVGLALIGLAMAGCSSDEGTDTPPPTTTTSSTTTMTTTAPPSETATLLPPLETSEAPVMPEPPAAEPEPEVVEPPVQPVALGDYCSSRGATATTWDGSTAYCSRLAGTDAYIWSLTAGVAPNPELQQIQTESNTSAVSPGDTCYDSDATATDSQGRTLYCNPTVNGRYAGNLVWQLLP
ncbi:hypothetical protein [Rhodococcus sp. Q]|uniref:hypothetical protein n=1 Tax=Rhodococcus sp. Q TaxID=2502252 RepID=UPI0010F54B47|nr:hypothetical protein [Rhodococcus sp. Q]